MTVHKYVLGIAFEAAEDGTAVSPEPHETELEVPQGAAILSVELSASGPAIYMAVDESAPLESRTFAVAGNGVDLPDGVDAMHYRGTAKVPGGPTWHVFELTGVKV